MPPLLYHHACELATVQPGVVVPRPISKTLPAPRCAPGRACPWDDWHEYRSYELAYEWLADQAGFYPLFLAVGPSANDKRMTGYQNQFETEAEKNGRRPQVLFSYHDKPADRIVFSDHSMWHVILNEGLNGLDSFGGGRHTKRLDGIPDSIRRSVLKPSWRDSDWLRSAIRDTQVVQAAVPSLDLREADRIWCPNEAAREEMLEKGFPEEKTRVHYLKSWV